MSKLKRVFRYLTGMLSIGIYYNEDAEDGEELTAYIDADHAGDQDKGNSTTGVVLYLAGGPVDWRSTKQTVVAISTVEAEYVALSKACGIVLHFRHLMKTIRKEQKSATVVFEDNQDAVALSRSNKITPRTKHVFVRWTREGRHKCCVECGPPALTYA